MLLGHSPKKANKQDWPNSLRNKGFLPLKMSWPKTIQYLDFLILFLT